MPSSGCILNTASQPCQWSCWERPVRGGKEVSEHSEDSGKTSLQDTPPEQVWKGQVILPGPRMAHQGIYDLGSHHVQEQGAKAPVPSVLSPQFLRLCDLNDPDFSRSKLSYRGRRSRRLCKILTFPLNTTYP